jgi:hypothetical protein
VNELSASELADLAGVTEAEVERMVDLGVLVARNRPAPFLASDVQKLNLATACERAGLPMDGIAAAIQHGPGGGRCPRPARAGPGDLLPGPGRLHPAHRGARRPGRRRAGRVAGVLAALEMVEDVPAAGLPPAHAGVAAGPVVVQGGDYFGRTVNLAARIASHAGAGQVLVSESVLQAPPPDGVRFVELGEVELKGFARPVRLLEARRAEEPGSAR